MVKNSHLANDDIEPSLKRYFPHWKNVFAYFPVRQLSVSPLFIITANLKCTVGLAASGDG